MKKGSSSYNEMPLPNRKIYDLVCEKTDGNVRVFADILGIKQQTLNRIFNRDPRNGKYPSVSDEIKAALKSKLGLDELWLFSGSEQDGDVPADDTTALLAEIERLKGLKLPTEKDKVMDIWLRYMENQRQHNEIMREMVELYKQIKGE